MLAISGSHVIWIVAVAILIQGSFSIRSSNDRDEVQGLDVQKLHYNASDYKCYCRSAQSIDDCQDKTGEKEHYYHDIEGKESLCCKDVESGVWNAIKHIRRYREQPESSFCFTEHAAVPLASCCHLDIKDTIGIRVSSARSARFDYRFWHTYVTPSDILGTVDWDGSSVEKEDIKSFLQHNFLRQTGWEWDPKLKFFCVEDIRSLVKTPSSSCSLRQVEPQQCCCKTEALQMDPLRCMAVEGAPQEVQAAIETFASSTGQHEEPKEPETALQVEMKLSETGDSVVLQREEHQWWSKCMMQEFIPSWQVHTCVNMMWKRHCPAGKSLYKALQWKGACFSARSGLVKRPVLMYQCPAGYTSPAHDRRCACASSCV